MMCQPDCVYADVQVAGITINVLVDTGAAVSCLSKTLYMAHEKIFGP